jgi:hypothetical protein
MWDEPRGRTTKYQRAAGRWISRFLEETPDASLEEAQLVSAALTALPRAPELARPVLRELARHRRLATVEGVLNDFVQVQMRVDFQTGPTLTPR